MTMIRKFKNALGKASQFCEQETSSSKLQFSISVARTYIWLVGPSFSIGNVKPGFYYPSWRPVLTSNGNRSPVNSSWQYSIT